MWLSHFTLYFFLILTEVRHPDHLSSNYSLRLDEVNKTGLIFRCEKFHSLLENMLWCVAYGKEHQTKSWTSSSALLIRFMILGKI